MDVEHHGHGMGSALTKKAGPLPLWMWGVGIGAIAVAVMWMHSRGGGAEPMYEPDADGALDGMDSALDTTYDGNNANDGGGSGGGGYGGYGDVSEAAADVDAVGASGSAGKGGKSNKRWTAKTFRALVASGKNPIAVQRALGLYLAGKPLNLKQKRLIKQALQSQGMPPQGAPGITVKRPPKRPQHGGKGGGKDDKGHTNPHTWNGGPSGPRRDRVVTTEDGDTYAKIAKRAYGSASGIHVDRVRRANGGGMNQSFTAGHTVKVPYHNTGRVHRGRGKR